VTVSVAPVDSPEPADLPPARVTRTRLMHGAANPEFDQQFQQQQ
jgi:hypothetical protein